MCVVSDIGDSWGTRFPDRWPNIPYQEPGWPYLPTDGVSRDEFNALRHEMQELKKLLLAAKAYDEATGQPDCEMDAKVELIRRVAEAVGVDVDDVFGPRDGR